MDIFTYMDRNPISTCTIAMFICISICVASTQFSEALQTLFQRFNAGKETEEKKAK